MRCSSLLTALSLRWFSASPQAESTRLATFGARLGFVTVAGVLAAIATNISYWNWYGFPTVYTAAYIFTQVVGFFLAGIAIALVLKNQRTAP